MNGSTDNGQRPLATAIRRERRAPRPSFEDVDERELTGPGEMLADELRRHFDFLTGPEEASYMADFAVKWMTSLESWAFREGVVTVPS